MAVETNSSSFDILRPAQKKFIYTEDDLRIFEDSIVLKSVFESARQRIVELSEEDNDAVGSSEADGSHHLDIEAPVSETTNPRLDEKKEKNQTAPSNSSLKEVAHSDEDIGKDCGNTTRGLFN